MKYKNLFIFSGAFPFFGGEQFLDDEFEELSKVDSNIVIICISDAEKKTEQKRSFINNNAHYIEIKLNKLEKILSIRYLFFPEVIQEIPNIYKRNRFRQKIQILKIILLDFAKARKIYSQSFPIIQKYSVEKEDQNLFYSYWHDIRAIGMTMMKKRFNKSKFIARAHGWDVYFERQNPPYLSFKEYLFTKLNSTILISNDAHEYIKDRFSHIENKLVVQKLGKNNSRHYITKKMDKTHFIICSCSSIIKIKRLDRIIKSLRLIEIPNVKWIHFGDGPLIEGMKTLAEKELKHISFEFRGNCSNSTILDFYAENFVDIFINLSSSEGIPVSIMEAISSGIPVIATNVGGTKEIINKKNGYLINKDLECSNISLILTEHFNKTHEEIIEMRKNAREYWFKNYNASKNYKRFIHFLNENL